MRWLGKAFHIHSKKELYKIKAVRQHHPHSLAIGQSVVRGLFCEQVSDSRIRPTGCLFVSYFLEWVSEGISAGFGAAGKLVFI
jgi:hypothetical protein